jgi:2-polyprenyl-6-methoxyphenol hydroxylase-like FAD-dependent oxidoreductase
VAVRLGTGIDALERVDGPVQVTFDDGRQGDYDLVVGADGLRSTVRRLVVDPRPPVPVGQHSWRFVTACPPGVTAWSVLLGPGSSLLTIPIGQGRVYCYADVLVDPDGPGPGGVAARPARGGPDGSGTGGDPAAFPRERFAGLPDPVPELLERREDPAQVHVAAIEQVAAERWGRGAVVLVGDAAHGMSPNMAQGAALAFEDALVLAACLREAGSVADALAGFVARRHPRTSWVRAQTHRRDRTRRLPPLVRDPLLRAFGERIFRSNYRPLLEPA